MVLVPQFREAEVYLYFNAFERIAVALKWPEEILLQSKLYGKAQEIVSALLFADSLCYATITEAVLRAYELVPEAYRQFRAHVEFAREKSVLFDRLCSANQVSDYAELRELLILEDVVHLSFF